MSPSPIIFAVVPSVSGAAESREALDHLSASISDKMGCAVAGHLAASYGEVVTELERERVQFAWMSPLLSVLAEERLRLRPLLSSVRDDRSEYCGVLFVDDSNPEVGAFGRSVRRELERVLPESPIVRLPAQHVLYKSYYLLDRPFGRVEGPPFLEAITGGKMLRVVLSSHDVIGAMAQQRGGGWTFTVEPGGQQQRELAMRLAVNLAMYVLCLDYKDDQVHAEELMRRRGRVRR